MRSAALAVALAGIVAANPAPGPTAAASLDARAATACDIDYDLGRPIQPPASIKSWLRTAQPPDDCTDVMLASLTAGWMSYLGQLSSFVAHAGEKTASLTDLCGSATYTVSIDFCSTQGKIVVTDEGSGDTVTTIANTVRNPGAVVLTSKNGKIGVASAAATPTGGESESDSVPASTGSSSSSSGPAKTSTKGSASPPTTGAATTSRSASKTSAATSSSATATPKNNAAGKIGAGVAAVAAGVAALAL